MAQKQILIVEDEKNLGLTLQERLEMEHFEVDWAQTCHEAKDQIDEKHYDLLVLDVGLPDGTGWDIAKYLNQKSIKSNIIFLTAFGTPEDRIHGLELGAQDYMVKPFHLRELILRVHNILGRTSAPSEDLSSSAEKAYKIGRALINFQKFQAETKETTYDLTQKECSVLKLLLQKKGNVVSRDEILNTAWSENEFPTSRTVDNFILRIRKIVEETPENPRLIRSVRGVGYMLND